MPATTPLADAPDHPRARQRGLPPPPHANDLLHIRFLRAAKRHWRKACVADSTGAHLRYWQTLVGGLAFADWFKRERPATRWSASCCPPRSPACW